MTSVLHGVSDEADRLLPEFVDLEAEFVEADPVVVDDRVGRGTPRCPARLLSDDGADGAPGPARSRHDALNLQGLGAIDEPDPIHPAPPAPRLDKQRDVQDRHMRVRRSDTMFDFGADEWMKNGFEALSGAGIGERCVAHARAIEGAVGVDEQRTEGGPNRVDGAAAGTCQRARDRVGIDQLGTTLDQPSRDRTLAAADTR